MLSVVKSFKRKKCPYYDGFFLNTIGFFFLLIGITFIVVATLLGLGWLILATIGFYTKDDIRFANKILVIFIEL